MRTGLVLEGGAMRGMFTAGVMDVMMEQGLRYDSAIGVSAGAAFGVNYKSGQIGRVLRYNVRFCRDRRYCGLGSYLKTGDLYSTSFCYGEAPLRLDPFDFDAYAKNPMRFYVVCTDVHTGEAVYHEYTGYADHGFDWIRASASLPLAAKIVRIDGRELLDGGMVHSIPLRYMESLGCRRNVVILTQPRGYLKKPNRLLPLIRRRYRAYPALIHALENRHDMYNAELSYVARREREGEAFVIRPHEALPIGRVEKDPKKLRMVYALGRAAAEEALPALTAFVARAEAEEQEE